MLTFFLWKFSFTAKVTGLFAFKDIMIRIPLHLNFSILIRLEQLSFTFTFSSKILKVSAYGFQLNILIRDDFNLWLTKKIEILQLLEDIRTTLRKKGQLQQVVRLVNNLGNLANPDGQQQRLDEDLSELNMINSNQLKMMKRQSSNIAPTEKTFMERMLHKLLSSFEIELKDSVINFYIYKDEEKKIEEANVKKFYMLQLLDKNFRDKFLCFRVFIPNAYVNIQTLNDDFVDLLIHSDSILLQNPKQMIKQGILKEAFVVIKIPLDKKLAKDFCNFEVKVSIKRAILNLNLKFIKSITKFVVCMDTLKEVIKRIKKLITKLHFQDELLKEFQFLHLDSSELNYENFKDEDIPKQLSVVIEDGLTIMIQEPSNQLRPFLQGGGLDQNRSQELIIMNTTRLSFQLLKTLKNSYLINSVCGKIAVECNLRQSILIQNFILDMSFSFKKQIQESPIKQTKMDMNITILLDEVFIDLTMSEAKLIFDIVDIYMKMVKKASIKTKIMDILLDIEFLKSNLLHLGTSQEEIAKEKQIMQLFKENKYKDTLIFDIQIKQAGRRYSAYDPLNSIKIDLNDFSFKIKDDKGIEEMIFKIGFMNVQPLRPKSISMIKIMNLENSITTTRGSNNLIQNISTTFNKSHFNVNMDHILSLTREILDFSLIFKNFSRKWNVKYAVKDYIKSTIIESLEFQFEESQIIWNMSKSRYLAFRLYDFKTKPLQCPFKNDDKIGMCYFAKEMEVYHSKTTLEESIPGQMYCLSTYDKDTQKIIDSKDFDFKMFITDKENKIKVTSSFLDFNLPDNLHFGAIIQEIVKQIAVSNKWFSLEYQKLKHRFGIQFAKLNQQPKPHQYIQQQSFTQAVKGRKKSLVIQVDVKEAYLQAEESAMKQIFLNKEEVMDVLSEKEVFKSKSPFIFKMLKKLKLSKINEKAMVYYLKNFKMTYEIPQQFLDFYQLYQVILNLDEARDSMSVALFKELDSGVHSYKCDYISWHIRNLVKPIVEVYQVEVNFLFINGLLNPDMNPSLFKAKTFSKIFKKYEIQHSYNKLVSKQFYDADIKINNVKANIQGQQTLLFFNDLGDIFKRFGVDDMSSQRDKKCNKLNFYSGIDLIRNRMHGKTRIQFNFLEAFVQPKRKCNRFESCLKLTFQDFYYYQIHNYQEANLRNIILSKSPLTSYESAFFKIPLVEMQMNMIYNQGKTQNHYTHSGAKDIGSYLEQLKAYSSKEVEIDCKLNIPSLGHRNDVEKDCSQIYSLIQTYFEKSPVPIFHYQRSHMKFFDQMAKEYFKKADYTSAVINRREKGGNQKIQSRRQNLFKIKIKAFLNDILGLFTDYKEQQNQQQNYPEHVLNERNLVIHRDKHLNEQSQRRRFKQFRDKFHENSFDNYKHFCWFFEFNPQSQSAFVELSNNSILNNFKTLFPQFILRNSQLQQEIMIARLNPEQLNPFSDIDDNSAQEDFVFSIKDTIGTLIQISYQQDKDISFDHNQSQKLEELKRQSSDSNPLLMGYQNEKQNEEKFTVKHMFDIKGIKFLYTQQIIELLTHHLVRGFDYKKLRKTDFINIENQKLSGNDRDFKFKFKAKNSNCDQSGAQGSNKKQQSINFSKLNRVALVGLRLEDPQINFQNELTKSQMLMTTARPTTAVIFGFQKNNTQNGQMPVYINPNEVNNGYSIKFHEEVVRYDLQIQVVEMDILVAPTVINLENPTFWLSNLGNIQLSLNNSENQRADRDLFSNKGLPLSDREQYKSENLLRKIITVKNIQFTFNFLEEEYADHLNPSMLIDMLVEKIDSEMNGPEMWHFVYVLKSILFDRGFKTEELKMSEILRIEEMNTLKIDFIKRMIDQILKRGQAEQHSNINKKIQYNILNGEFKFYNMDVMFSQVVVSRASGTHLIYQNRDSKVDIDIDRILIENFADSEQYRMVLFPGHSFHGTDNVIQQQVNPETMIKIRARDKYVVVKEAPWRVYDQFEVFIFPSSLQFTKNFFKSFKSFFFNDVPNFDNNDKSDLEIKKYELLVPTKILQRAQGRNRSNQRQDESQKNTPKREQMNRLSALKSNEKDKELDLNDEDVEQLNLSDLGDNLKQKSVKRRKSTYDKGQQQKSFPIFFRYMRMNEINVSITYFQNKNSFFNTKNLKIKMAPFIRHGKFVTFKKIFEKYERHCKQNFISQIPNLIKQRFLQTKENLKVGKTKEDMEDELEEQQEQKKEIKLQLARKLLFGEFAEQ
ncbi:UNKNOWN [Stylonychia lemnae]|uniref:Uncharacterized protein n=1 Tax=Stylonychia lemnae TaxID=5949 RepID=A0A078AAC7_STYLE|nr:UNKNOWN [Stylonychia lemnae]|eukprot:CDW78547.1 UNKNOWN [Stylonychia lemnae]